MIITEELARVSSSLRVQVNMQELGCGYTIYKYGNEEVRKNMWKTVYGRIYRRFRHH